MEEGSSSWRPINVYLSHRGDEYGVYDFTDKLCGAFETAGLTTLENDEELEADDPIPPHLLKAIHEAWLSIFVFSKTHAASIGRLVELEEIVWRIHKPRGVLLIFFDVEESQLKEVIDEIHDKITSRFNIFTSRTPDDMLDMYCTRIEPSQISKAINKIVSDVMIQLHQLNYVVELVGMQSRVTEVEELLNLDSDDEVRVVGIYGMGGIGKSTLALALYRSISRKFDASYFIDHISDQLLRDEVSLIKSRRPNHHKILLVLDGVDHVQNLDALNLVAESKSFGGGSRIIITTRDERVLQVCEVDAIYKPKILSGEDALQLFCIKAFGHGYPMSGFEEMTDRVLKYANGLPLAIVALGSFLCQKSVKEWRSALAELKRIPNAQIMEVLRTSFDELDDKIKEMFLDITCFFTRKEINCVKEILHSRGFSVEDGIKRLIEKSLMTILDQKIEMHNMVQEMGRHIVRKGLPYRPSEWSRLWSLEDIYYVMQENENTAMERVEAIALDLEDSRSRWTTLKIEALSRMTNLRLLIFHNVNVEGTLDCLSNKLEYISWHRYPYTSLPSSFEPHALVELIMIENNIKEMWEGRKRLPTLKKLNLSGSKNLIKMPDFGGVPNLEWLNLEGCTRLLRFHPSIADIPKLKFLNVRNCINLVSIPNKLFARSSLEILNLTGCSKFAYCLRFSHLKSSAEVKLLSNWYHPFLEMMLYFFLFVLPQYKNYHQLVCCCLIYLISMGVESQM